MPYTLEDLGIAAFSDVWMTWRVVRDPRDGRELAAASLSRGGFILVDPARRSVTQIECERPFGCAWGIAQGPKGDIYQCDYGAPDAKLSVWRWDGPLSRVIAQPVVQSVFTIDVAPDGRVYIPDYTANTLLRYDPAGASGGVIDSLGDFNSLTPHIRNVVCGRDGWVYLLGYGYTPAGDNLTLIGVDPKTGSKAKVELPRRDDGWVFKPWLTRDAGGRALVATTHWGRTIWFELHEGRPQPIDQALIRLDDQGTPLVFGDGSFIRKVTIEFKDLTTHSLEQARLAAAALPAPAKPSPGTKIAGNPASLPPIASRAMHGRVEFVTSDGAGSPFDIEHHGSPLRIFSIAHGGGRIWGGTFIPLCLFSFDPATSTYQHYGNPTTTGGEIYNMAFAAGKLFMVSYTDAVLTRYDPARPYREDKSAHANPADLGRMKDTGLPLQRPHGRAMDSRGNIYFAAHGGYGCIDSGLVRIDPHTEEVKRWVFAETDAESLVYIAGMDRLMLTERRKGERAIRFTFINPHDGTIEWSEPVIEDEGQVFSLLDSPEGVVYGMHAWRATLFAFYLRRKVIVNRLPEMRVGEHCHNVLIDGPDGRIWGLTTTSIFAVTRDFKQVEVLAQYPDHGGASGNRFGLCLGPDGCLYFPNGTHLMRMRVKT